ncbi:MAG: hypothetical protein HY720_24080 [Planctomycetes bacterium]|nr:hypothetical protein [Planctomycetota bacterium]
MNLDRIIGRTAWDRLRFVASVLLDALGSASYIGYLFGPGAIPAEGSDVVFAPIQAAWLLMAYGGRDAKAAAIFGAVEELLPATDIVPTCTIHHVWAMRKKYATKAPEEEVKEIDAKVRDARD